MRSETGRISGSNSGHWEWNSCGSFKPTCTFTFFNDNQCPNGYFSEQHTIVGDRIYGGQRWEDYVEPGESCGGHVTIAGNFMELWELDMLDWDDEVGTLYFPNLQAILSCSGDECGPDWSNPVSPNGGITSTADAEILMRVTADYDEEIINPIPTPTPALAGVGGLALARMTRGLAGAVSHTAPRASRQQSGRLDGTVVRADSGNPLPDVRIVVVSRNGGQRTVTTVRTDSIGRFSLTELDPGQAYEIVAFAPGYGRTRIVATAGDAIFEIGMTRAARVSGQVVDSTGRPVAGQVVDIVYQRDEAAERRTLLERGVRSRILRSDWHGGQPVTDAEGRFLLTNVDAATPFSLIVSVVDGRSGTTDLLILAPDEIREDVIVTIS